MPVRQHRACYCTQGGGLLVHFRPCFSTSPLQQSAAPPGWRPHFFPPHTSQVLGQQAMPSSARIPPAFAQDPGGVGGDGGGDGGFGWGWGGICSWKKCLATNNIQTVKVALVSLCISIQLGYGRCGPICPARSGIPWQPRCVSPVCLTNAEAHVHAGLL